MMNFTFLFIPCVLNNVKFSDAQQAKIFNLYKNTKDKLLRTNAAFWYNKLCGAEHLLLSMHT